MFAQKHGEEGLGGNGSNMRLKKETTVFSNAGI
jgi:hypothetical protein